MKQYFILLLTLSITLLYASAKPHTIAVGGLERTYYLHLPSHYQKEKTPPLVFFLHGGGQNIKKMARSSQLNKLADRYNFIVAYPVGIDKHWKDGRGETYGGKSQANVDDVKFIKKLITKLIRTHKVNAKKVYVIGVSNGGLMTLRLGCDLSQKLSASAAVIANIPKKYIGQCKPKKTLPVLLMNGTADPIVPYYGGSMKFFKKRMGEVVSTEKTIDFWRRHNHCNKTRTITHLPDVNKRDKSSVNVSTYTHCKNNATVKLYSIQGGGHTMPGKKGFNMPRIVGQKNRDIEGLKVIVDFLLKH